MLSFRIYGPYANTPTKHLVQPLMDNIAQQKIYIYMKRGSRKPAACKEAHQGNEVSADHVYLILTHKKTLRFEVIGLVICILS